MSRAASSSVAACASWNCTPWNSDTALPNCLPLLGERDRRVERAARDADHLRADADAAGVERLDRDLVALADRAEHVLLRHLACVEEQFGGAAGADAELVLLLPHGESLEAALDNERRDPLVAGRRVHGREDDEDPRLGAVRDPELPAVEQILAVLLDGARREAERIRARARLGERVRAHRVRSEPREILRLLRLAAVASRSDSSRACSGRRP